MHRPIRLVLPVVAVTSALTLSACGGGDVPFDSFMDDAPPGLEESLGLPGGEGGAEGMDLDGLDLEGLDLEGLDLEGLDLEGGTGGDIGDSVPDPEGGDSGDGSLVGYWATGDSREDAKLDIVSLDSVDFFESYTAEGDICHGSVSGDTLTFDSCSTFGDTEWSEMSATLAVNGDTLEVTWASGNVQVYTRS